MDICPDCLCIAASNVDCAEQMSFFIGFYLQLQCPYTGFLDSPARTFQILSQLQPWVESENCLARSAFLNWDYCSIILRSSSWSLSVSCLLSDVTQVLNSALNQSTPKANKAVTTWYQHINEFMCDESQCSVEAANVSKDSVFARFSGHITTYRCIVELEISNFREHSLRTTLT